MCVGPARGLTRSLILVHVSSISRSLSSLSAQGAALEGKTSFCFSYGSGAIATAFTITARAPETEKARFSCEAIGKALDLEARLATRTGASRAA